MRAPLKGFKFADAQSRANAEMALCPDRPAAFYIYGPPMSGKTLLASRIVLTVFPQAVPVGLPCPQTETAMDRAITREADQSPWIIVEDFRPHWLGAVSALEGFLRSASLGYPWVYRKLHTTRLCKLTLNNLTLILSSAPPPEDWTRVRPARRGDCGGALVRVIQLAAGGGRRKVVRR